MFEAITPQLFTSGQNAKVFLGEPFKGREIPGKKTVTLSGAVIPGQLIVSVNAIDFDLYEGTPLSFTPGTLYVADFAPQGSTTLKVNRHAKTIAGGSTCDLWAWIPLFSVKQFSVDGQLGELTDNTVSKLETDKAINSMSKTVSISGPKIFGDPGMAIINSLQIEFLGYKVKTWLVKALGRGEELLDCYFAKSEQTDNTSFDRVSLAGVAITTSKEGWTLTGAGVLNFELIAFDSNGVIQSLANYSAPVTFPLFNPLLQWREPAANNVAISGWDSITVPDWGVDITTFDFRDDNQLWLSTQLPHPPSGGYYVYRYAGFDVN